MILCCSFFFVYIFLRIMQFDAHDMADLLSAVAVAVLADYLWQGAMLTVFVYVHKKCEKCKKKTSRKLYTFLS